MKKVFIISFLFMGFILFCNWFGIAFHEPISSFNTVYTQDFNVNIWEEEIGLGMTRMEVRKLLGEPFREQTRCDFYSRPKIRLLGFNEYKVCYNEEEKFFLKFKFDYPGFNIMENSIGSWG